MSDKKRKKLTADQTVVVKSKAPLKRTIPVGESFEVEIEYFNITGSEIEDIELDARLRSTDPDGNLDQRKHTRELSRLLREKYLVSIAGRKFDEKYRIELSSPVYQAVDRFLLSLVRGE